MRRLAGWSSIHVFSAAMCGLALLFPVRSSAQSTQTGARPDSRAAKDYASSGQLNVLVQDTAGEPFFQGATITVLTRDIATRLSMLSDEKGRARFTSLPVGQYLVEITATGYRTVQSQVILSTTREAQTITATMVPNASGGTKVSVGSGAASRKAAKESERALRAMELNLLDEAQQHLTLALTIDGNFADGNYLMGLLLLRQKQPARAAAYLQKSLALSPDHAASLLALGEAQYLAQDYPQASESLETFLRNQPHSPQAPIAQKYVDALRKFVQTAPASEGPSTAGPSAASPASAALPADADLPPISALTPDTETNWAPPDVDEEKLAVDADAPCQLAALLQSAGRRVQELVSNVARFTATEHIEHYTLSSMGLESSRETRKFNYLVEIQTIGSGVEVQEYRNGSDAPRQFPEQIVTTGLPSLALILHANLQPRYDFRCEGRGTWEGKPAWVLHFQQRPDRPDGMLTYQVGRRSVAVALKGRAWIDVASSQILAMESDMIRPAPEIRLKRDHQLIVYGPVSFRDKGTQLWLPKSADWYCSMSGHRFHRRHSFTNFLLFSVDDKQKISTPTIPDTSPDPG